MIVFAHAGDWWTALIYLAPVIGVGLWLAVSNVRERRSSSVEGSGDHEAAPSARDRR